ncbi:hypothetical protein PRIPAC_96786 [Pristionchus pacificus]|uniref:Uncharacterized protein n=1 Tax=Pristionchus pacificus TaxID=54126 RepID=A0A2A6CUD4_PRIPA|nr:hypothetical protein PRIPAC_96786 [Pristionchus pacificus]|eukprot:PDM81653.1 hypothetical protein PRIPAC_30634 [Pristionchus pacificus]
MGESTHRVGPPPPISADPSEISSYGNNLTMHFYQEGSFTVESQMSLMHNVNKGFHMPVLVMTRVRRTSVVNSSYSTQYKNSYLAIDEFMN